ncbi:MAG: DUF433 domain-containing protein [Planctomycetaceae bacterium]
MQNILAQHITKTPGVCGGKACVAGHRVRVSDIVVSHEQRGYSPDEIVGMFPGIAWLSRPGSIWISMSHLWWRARLNPLSCCRLHATDNAGGNCSTRWFFDSHANWYDTGVRS